MKHVSRCLHSGELATVGARLRTAIQGAASQLQLTELKEQRAAQRGLRAQARKSELKSSSGPAILLDMGHKKFTDPTRNPSERLAKELMKRTGPKTESFGTPDEIDLTSDSDISANDCTVIVCSYRAHTHTLISLP